MRWRGGPMATVWLHFAGVLATLLLPGCGRILGVDEYAVGCAAGSVSAAGACLAMPECGASERPTAGGGCSTVGVDTSACGAGFEPDPERAGACRESLPPADCAERRLVNLGSRDCALGFNCGKPFFNTAPTQLLTVDAGAAREPGAFATIGEALAAAGLLTGNVTIAVAPGIYRESLRVDHPVTIAGYCPRNGSRPGEETVIEGVDGGAPVIDITAAADGTSIQSLAIRGVGSAGVRAVGVEKLFLSSLLIGPVDGPGVSLKGGGSTGVEPSGVASALLFALVVEQATGAGIDAWGVAPLTMDSTRIAGVRPGPDGLGVGIRLGPSPGVVPQPADAAGADGGTAPGAPAFAIIRGSRVDGAVGVGVVVRGVEAALERVSVHRVAADREGAATGILVEPLYQGSVPARVSVSHSVVSDVEGAGIRLEDVTSATLEDVTIHDVGLAPSAEDSNPLLGGCGGSGVRVRRRLSPPGNDEPVVLRRLLVDGARESGLHVEGQAVRLEDSLIRNINSCNGRFGDGLSVYGYEFSPTSLTAVRSRVDSVARHTAALWQAEASLADTSLEGCGAVVTSGERTRVSGQDTSLCECDGRWSRCEPAKPDAVPALVGYPECDPDSYLCSELCAEGLTGAAGAARIPGWGQFSSRTSWANLHADANGCGVYPLAPGVEASIGTSLRGYAPAQNIGFATRPGRFVFGRQLLIPDSVFTNQTPFFPDRTSERADVRRALFIAIQVCPPQTGPVLPDAPSCFMQTGVEGVAAELLLPSGARIDAPWAVPAYFSAQSSVPEPGRTVTSANATAYFWNVPANDYVVRLSRPDGRRLSCSLDPTGTGVQIGRAGTPENTYRARGTPSVLTLAALTYCSVE